MTRNQMHLSMRLLLQPTGSVGICECVNVCSANVVGQKMSLSRMGYADSERETEKHSMYTISQPATFLFII